MQLLKTRKLTDKIEVFLFNKKNTDKCSSKGSLPASFHIALSRLAQAPQSARSQTLPDVNMNLLKLKVELHKMSVTHALGFIDPVTRGKPLKIFCLNKTANYAVCTTRAC